MSTPLRLPVNPPNLLIWTGRSGTTYELHNYRIGTNFRAVPGVYIFCRPVEGGWRSVYVGETDNLARRLTAELTAHHQLAAMRRQGATHVAALVVAGSDAERRAIETDLRHGLNPPCNQQ